MARTKEFNREEALLIGMDVFWRKGFSATTTDDLRLEMGIGRQSFYDTFGDKRRCYLDALRAYVVQEVSSYISTLRGAGAPLVGLRNLLLIPASWDEKRRTKGCLAMNALSEFGSLDADVTAALAPAQLMLERGVVGLLAEAKAKGDVPSAVDEYQAARAFICTRAGLIAAAKGGMATDQLRSIAEFTVDRLTY
ncbi:TetR/AcrR family transcriptional regulator [uncultured Devosia sp.]|uniref:TetR/AcrR family transcriptional regulator n=1 Tax=uncultured Devosia sp. TaxID=211434 RepID=UPI0035CB8A7C